MKKKLFIYPIFCLLSLGLLTTSCSSDDDSQSIVEGNKKIKITLPKIPQAKIISLIAS